MKKIEKAKDWAVTLAAMREELAALPPDQDAARLKAKIANLERAIAIRSSLSAKDTPQGKMEFGL